MLIVPGRLLYRATERMQAALSGFTNFVAERMMNIRLVKASAAESAELQAGIAAAEASYKADVRLGVIEGILYPFKNSTQGVIDAIIFLIGAGMVASGEMGLEDLITVYMYGAYVTAYLFLYISVFHEAKRAQGATRVVAELLETPPERMEREVSFTQEAADIVFDDVSFRYQNRDVLSHVSFTIPTGKVTAIVGPLKRSAFSGPVDGDVFAAARRADVLRRAEEWAGQMGKSVDEVLHILYAVPKGTDAGRALASSASAQVRLCAVAEHLAQADCKTAGNPASVLRQYADWLYDWTAGRFG